MPSDLGPSINERVLEYDSIGPASPVGKLKWVVIAAAFSGLIGILMQLTTFALFWFEPTGGFSTVGSGLRRGKQIDWGQLSIAIASSAVTLWAFCSALMYLCGYRARRSLVLANWTLILFSAGAMVNLYFMYRAASSLPNRIVYTVWDTSQFLQGAILPALVILCFGSRNAPATLSELLTPAASSEALPRPDRTPGNRSL